MSIRNVAKLAGVSISTVSRVINSHPSVASGTAESVREAMQKLKFKPVMRRISSSSSMDRPRTSTIALLVFGTTGSTTAPAFERLLQGVSTAAAARGFSLIFNFISDTTRLPNLKSHQASGFLLHGELPAENVRAELQQFPCVWVMANRRRPTWGDQVMPDNNVIGEIAAKYLLSRGHRRVAYVGTTKQTWYLGVRALAFRQAVIETGAEAGHLVVPEPQTRDFWRGDGLPECGEMLAQQILDCNPRPTGIFIAEDRLLPVVHIALQRRGVKLGLGRDIEIISCNNEKPHLLSLQSPVATIDLRTEAIGLRGVEQLLWRIENGDVRGRVRTMIEPVLVEPALLSENLTSDGNHFVLNQPSFNQLTSRRTVS